MLKLMQFTELNSTGLFSDLLLDYLTQSYMQVEALYENDNSDLLFNGHMAYLNYIKNVDHNFTINEFFKAAGFNRAQKMLSSVLLLSDSHAKKC